MNLVRYLHFSACCAPVMCIRNNLNEMNPDQSIFTNLVSRVSKIDEIT